MVALVPDERVMGLKVDFNPDQGSRDGLYIGLKLEAGELVDLIQDCLAHFGDVDDLADLLRIHVIKVVPLELRLLLDLARNVF